MRRLELVCVAALLFGCASPPASVEPEQPEAEPRAVVIAEPEPPAPAVPILGEPEPLAGLLGKLDGLWAFEGEVWEIAGARARVFRPLEADVVGERTLEFVAPCMFVAREGEALLGPYVVDRRSWSRGGVGIQVEGDVLTLCHGADVYRVVGQQCEAWRYDPAEAKFVGQPNSCTVSGTGDELRVSLVGPEGERPVVADEQTAVAASVLNLASGCGRLDPEGPGCTAAQTQALRDAHWATDDGSCSGADLRVELATFIEGANVLGPRTCPLVPTPDQPSFAVEPGVVMLDNQARVRPGATSKIELVFENTATQPRVVRLPTGVWNLELTRAGEVIEQGGCGAIGAGGGGALARAAEFRLDPGGRLTLVTEWTASGPIYRGDSCHVGPLPAKIHALTLRMSENEPTAVLRAEISVRGKPTCDPCDDPWAF